MSTTIDRRELLVGAGAAVAVAYLPGALAAAVPAVGADTPRATLTAWHIDDMWGVYPRPHEALGYGRPRGDGEALAACCSAADLPFLPA